MNTKIVISCLLLAFAISACQAASLDTALYARYVCRSRTDGFKTLVPGSCSQYYQCQDGKAQLNTCPRFFDALNKECVYNNPGCVETIIKTSDCDGPCCGIANDNYAVDTNNQAVYYLCKNNAVAANNICPNGEMFDLIKLKCGSASRLNNFDLPCTTTTCTTTKAPCKATTTCTTTKQPCTTTKAPYTTTTTCEPTTTPYTTTKAPSTTTTTSESTTAPCTTTTCTTTTSTTTTCTTTTCTTTTCTTTTCTTTTFTTTTCTTTTDTTTTCTTTTCTTTPCTTTTCTTTNCTTTNSTTSTSTTTSSTTTTSTTTTSTKTTSTTTTCTTTTCTTTTCTTTPCTTTTCTTTTCTTTTCTTTTCSTTTCTTTPCTTTTCTTTTCTTTSCTTTTCTTTTCTTTTCTTTTCTTTTCTTTNSTTTKVPCKQTTTTCTTTAPCVTTEANSNQAVPAYSSDDKPSSVSILKDPSHYVLPSKMSNEEINDYIRYGCIDKPEGFLLPSLTKCNAYFICRNNIALPVTCGKRYFNVRQGICDLPRNTGCIQAN